MKIHSTKLVVSFTALMLSGCSSFHVHSYAALLAPEGATISTEIQTANDDDVIFEQKLAPVEVVKVLDVVDEDSMRIGSARAFSANEELYRIYAPSLTGSIYCSFSKKRGDWGTCLRDIENDGIFDKLHNVSTNMKSFFVHGGEFVGENGYSLKKPVRYDSIAISKVHRFDIGVKYDRSVGGTLRIVTNNFGEQEPYIGRPVYINEVPAVLDVSGIKIEVLELIDKGRKIKYRVVAPMADGMPIRLYQY